MLPRRLSGIFSSASAPHPSSTPRRISIAESRTIKPDVLNAPQLVIPPPSTLYRISYSNVRHGVILDTVLFFTPKEPLTIRVTLDPNLRNASPSVYHLAPHKRILQYKLFAKRTGQVLALLLECVDDPVIPSITICQALHPTANPIFEVSFTPHDACANIALTNQIRTSGIIRAPSFSHRASPLI